MVTGVVSESRKLAFAAAMRVRSSAFVTIGTIKNSQLNQLIAFQFVVAISLRATRAHIETRSGRCVMHHAVNRSESARVSGCKNTSNCAQRVANKRVLPAKFLHYAALTGAQSGEEGIVVVSVAVQNSQLHQLNTLQLVCAFRLSNQKEKIHKAAWRHRQVRRPGTLG